MAHVILFTDRSPSSWNFDAVEWNKRNYSYPAGAAKIASHLRQLGLRVIVINNCLSYSLSGIKTIIQNNDRDLLWIGISSTFLTSGSSRLALYRKQWAESEDLILRDNHLYDVKDDYFGGVNQMAWGDTEINLISGWCSETYDCPILIGGSWVTEIVNGNLNNLDSNCIIVKGYAESYVQDFTLARLHDKDHAAPLFVDNKHYDDHGFKFSSMVWRPEDFIHKDDWLPTEVARGCSFNCAYCSYQRKSTTDNYKDPDTLRQELIRNYEHFGVTRYMLLDDLYNDDKQKIRILYDRVWSKLPFAPEWTSYMRLDMFWADRDSAEYIKASGAKIGSFGIETLDDRAGKKVGKGLGRARILETLQFLKEQWQDDVLITALFIAGLPFEPRDSILDSMQWSLTTDLIYSSRWAPMWITPPDHFGIVNNLTQLSRDNQKYGIRWLDHDTWINTEGITNKEMNALVAEVSKKQPMGLKLTHATYVDLRSGGFTHADIVKAKTDTTMIDRLLEAKNLISNKIDQRLNQALLLTDV